MENEIYEDKNPNKFAVVGVIVLLVFGLYLFNINKIKNKAKNDLAANLITSTQDEDQPKDDYMLDKQVLENLDTSTSKSVQTLRDENTNSMTTNTKTETPKSDIDTSSSVLDLSSDYNIQNKLFLEKAYTEPANFNDHYVVTGIGCGTGCFYYTAIDKNNGKVYQLPVANDIGSFTGDIGSAYTLSSDTIKVVTESGSKINTYKFDGTRFFLLSSMKNS